MAKITPKAGKGAPVKDGPVDTAESSADAIVDRAVAEGGAYEVLQRRLQEQGRRLRGLAEGLNTQRLAQFGSSRMEIVGRARVRTENNCVARDIVQVGDLLLFGYNVFIGLKKETRVEDVFALFRLVEQGDAQEFEPVPVEGSFLSHPGFAQDFRELYAYYRDTRLIQLSAREDRVFAVFQIGERITDVRVFRWAVDRNGEVRYIDNRGERDVALPAPFDFEWTPTTREMVVNGRHPHVNILDTVFVETVGGDLTIKVENNTNDGLGIYREPVQDQTQSLDDAQIFFARLGSLILLKIRPYREEQWRYLVFNALNQSVLRIDAIGQACIQLPEDHGIIFPGGYYLPSGDTRAFEQSMEGMRFKRMIRSPNGEDVLYIFYDPEAGRTALFTYNMIERRLTTPIIGHGYARVDDGRMVIFANESDEPTRIHPMQVWATPFCTEEHAAAQPAGEGFIARIGNPELVRGISDLLSLVREIEAEAVSAQRYELLTRNTRRVFDLHHWVEDPACAEVGTLLHEVVASSEAVLDEFEKVQSIRRDSARAMTEAATRHRDVLARARPDDWKEIGPFVAMLGELSALRGHLLTVRGLRYIDVAAIDGMEQGVLEAQAQVGQATAAFLAGESALAPFGERLAALEAEGAEATGTAQLRAPLQGMEAMSAELDTLSELMATLQVEDPQQRTRIVEGISAVYARLNQAKARLEQRRRGMGGAEMVAQFGAQFTLFGQSITNALALATDPERCDEQLARLLVQLEELESQFGEHEQFLSDILAKREEMLEAFDAHRQALVDDRQRRAQAVADAAMRILEGLGRRTARLSSADELNAFFAGDALIVKLRELVARLRELHDNVRADDVEARLKAARDSAVRGQRDRADLYEDGGNLIRLGRHRFSVSTQELDLTILPRGEGLSVHLTGTDYFEPIRDPALEALRPFWQAGLESESADVYRAEYLAAQMLDAARERRDGLDPDRLAQLVLQPEALDRAIRDFAAPRYREGYERGIHDHDAGLLLAALVPMQAAAGVLAHAPVDRALALLFWSQASAEPGPAQWPARARTASDIHRLFGRRDGLASLQAEIAEALAGFIEGQGLPLARESCGRAAAYLLAELAVASPQFAFSRHARELLDALEQALGRAHAWEGFRSTLDGLGARLAARWQLAFDWLQAMVAGAGEDGAGIGGLGDYVPEAAALLLVGEALPHRVSEVDLRVRVDGLLGDHPRIQDGALVVGVDEFGARMAAHAGFVEGVRGFQAARHEVIVRERAAMRLEEFKPRPLTSFVRNKLINDAYLPVIGDNLAKQMGAAGDERRSDLSGLLMMISPPGYGKTTLMEYVAHRLGLVFMKINGPSLGQEVRSLDPEQAPDATSRQELEKLNLALEMGNNVMLYVDDIQHTHPEFLQKFISLCDGTRRIEGVWRGRTRTYDMRGKKFCVVMAGNPYTESGEVFKIPDMLANRADVYNLGDVLGGMEDAFTLSYIENSLTSNPVLAPLATRDLADLYLFVDKAQGREVSANAFSHAYSAAESNEIVGTLQRLIRVRDVVYRVNQAYIASAAQADAYRTEPAFRLQGSYRNMNKLAEKVSAVMNEAEMQQLLHDHYIGEAQMLTTGAEENLLKLAELRGSMDEAQATRWAQIKRDFLRNRAMGGADSDVGQRVVAQLVDLVDGVKSLGAAREAPAQDVEAPQWTAIRAALDRIAEAVQAGPAAPALTAPSAAQDEGGDHRALTAAIITGLRTGMKNAFDPLVEALDEHDHLRAVLSAMAGILRERQNAPGYKPSTRELELEQALNDFAERLKQRRSGTL